MSGTDLSDYEQEMNPLTDIKGHISSHNPNEKEAKRIDLIMKFVITFVMLICFPLIVYFGYFKCNLNESHTVEILTGFVQFLYFSYFYIVLFRSKYLYRIQPRYAILPKWARISLPITIDEYKTTPIESVSEFSSIRGSMNHLLLFFVGLFTFATYFGVFLHNESYWNNASMTELLAAIFQFGCGFGLTWLSIWELNPNDNIHKYMHYIGVGICCLSNIGFCLQQNWNVYSVLLLVGLLMCIIIWLVISYMFGNGTTYNQLTIVTRVSMACIIISVSNPR
eukprot:448137_1